MRAKAGQTRPSRQNMRILAPARSTAAGRALLWYGKAASRVLQARSEEKPAALSDSGSSQCLQTILLRAKV